MKKEIRQNINEIKKISSKFPRTINEALNFNSLAEDDDIEMDDEPMDEPETDMPMDDESMPENNASAKAKKLIDDIRKMSLKAMADLADTPESPEYENLKRIWQLCDKAVSEKQEQREVMQKNNRF